jgi:hypothetical protein
LFEKENFMKTNLIATLALATASVMFGAQAPAPVKPATSTVAPVAGTTGKTATAKKHARIFHKRHAKKVAKANAVAASPTKPATK